MDVTPSELDTPTAFQYKKIWIPVVAILLLGAVATFILRNSPSTHSVAVPTSFVSGGNDCPTVEAISLNDFSNPLQVPWVWTRVPAGVSATVFTPKGSRADIAGDVANDTIVGFPLISQNSVFQDHASLKLYYQGNLDMYAADLTNAYFVYLPNRTAWKGEQLVMAIPGADPSTFVALQAGGDEHSYTGFAADKDHVYFLGDVVPDVTPSTFRLLNYHYALASDASGNLVFLSAPENTTREDGPVQLSRRVLTPLEVAYIKSVTAPKLGASPPIVFTKFRESLGTNTAEIRTIVDSGTSYTVRRYLPSIYGVFTPGSQHPSVCFAAEDFLIRSSLVYKSHALLQTLQGKEELVNADLSSEPVESYVLPFGLDYYSQIIFDKPNGSLWVLKNTLGNDPSELGYSLTQISLDDAIAGKTTGRVLLEGKGSHVSNLVIPSVGRIAAAVYGPIEGQYNLVTIDLTTGTMNTVASAGGGKDTYSPLFISADSKTLFYWLSPYEAFDEASPFVYRHDLSAPAVDFGGAGEVTAIRVGNYTSTEDAKTLYYLYETKPIISCNGVDGYYSNSMARYDTILGTSKPLFTGPGNTVLTKMRLDPAGKQLSVDIYSPTASTTDTGAPCVVDLGNKLETKSLSL